MLSIFMKANNQLRAQQKILSKCPGKPHTFIPSFALNFIQSYWFLFVTLLERQCP